MFVYLFCCSLSSCTSPANATVRRNSNIPEAQSEVDVGDWIVMSVVYSPMKSVALSFNSKQFRYEYPKNYTCL